MKKLKILMFAPSCYPPGNPESFVNANLATVMLEAGWQVDVVTCPDEAYQWYPESTNLWKDLSLHCHPVEGDSRTLWNKALNLLHCLVVSGQRTGGYTWAVPAAKQALKLAAGRQYDLIISRSLPPQAHLAAYIVARKTGIPWIANWNDPTPFCMFPEPYNNGNSGHDQMTQFWERRFYRAIAKKADWHTFPCARLQTYVKSYLPSDIQEKSSVIPHVASRQYAGKRRKQEKFTLMHAGSLRPPRDPESFLLGVKLFLEQMRCENEISVRFVADNQDGIREAVLSNGLEKIVQLEPTVPYEEMMERLTAADVLVIIEARVQEGIFLPSKFVDYIQTGRPILAVSPRVGTLADTISSYGGGVAVDAAIPESIASGIRVLYDHWRSNVLDERFGSGKLFPLFNRDMVLGEYLQLHERLAHASAPARGLLPQRGCEKISSGLF